MKVTALLPDKLIEEVRKYSGGKNTTEALVIALEEWLALTKVKRLNKRLKKKPLEFQKGFSAEHIRTLSRRR